jgi:hypothetical protein
MLRYCAWCGRFQGAVFGEGHQIRQDVCEIDTLTICPSCLAQRLREVKGPRRRHRIDRS